MTLGINRLIALIKQSNIISKHVIVLDYSSNNLNILRPLLLNGYIKNYKLLKYNKIATKIVVSLKLDKSNNSAITGISSVSSIEKPLRFKRAIISKHRQNLASFFFTSTSSNNLLFAIS